MPYSYTRCLRNNEDTLCILYSGGIDSLVATAYAHSLNLWKTINCLFVDLGQPYNEAERFSVLKAKSYFDNNTKECNFILLEFPILSNCHYIYDTPTLTSQIIPGRNMLLANIAANFGDTIWMNALYGELIPKMTDKNHIFFNMASSTLSYTYGKDILVESALCELTKTQVVELALSLGITKEMLKLTNTCYGPQIVNGEIIGCGNCLACFKRKVSFVNNGIKEKYKVDPFVSWYALDIQERIIKNKLDKRLVQDYMNAYKLENKDLLDSSTWR